MPFTRITTTDAANDGDRVEPDAVSQKRQTDAGVDDIAVTSVAKTSTMDVSSPIFTVELNATAIKRVLDTENGVNREVVLPHGYLVHTTTPEISKIGKVGQHLVRVYPKTEHVCDCARGEVVEIDSDTVQNTDCSCETRSATPLVSAEIITV